MLALIFKRRVETTNLWSDSCTCRTERVSRTEVRKCQDIVDDVPRSSVIAIPVPGGFVPEASIGYKKLVGGTEVK